MMREAHFLRAEGSSALRLRGMRPEYGWIHGSETCLRGEVLTHPWVECFAAAMGRMKEIE